ncbi:efflux transporter outer membrane subunit [Roseiterribacter gracilis]
MTKRGAYAALLIGLLSSCAVGPDYVRPTTDIPASFKEQAGWKVAAPNDAAPRGAWWQDFNDPTLDNLQDRLLQTNQSLRVAEANYRQATALTDQAQSQLFPTVGASFDATRSGTANSAPTGAPSNSTARTSYRANATANWDIDLWGRIRRSIEAQDESALASAADLANARLSLQAQLASAYVQLRFQDEFQRLLDTTVEAYARSLQITQNQYNVGLVARSDVDQAETQLAQTQAQAIANQRSRAQLEHAIAVLVGTAPADFTLKPTTMTLRMPPIPMALPSTLLERRPDVASAERRVASANAEIGVAIAAWFPDLSLSGSYGVSGSPISKLFRASNVAWSAGASVAETIFDAGARSARIDQARAAYDGTVAQYRLTVLGALAQVEDQLVALDTLKRQGEAQAIALRAARSAEQSIIDQYRAGRVAYTSVVQAQAQALQAEQSSITVRQNQLLAAVVLIQALGGGWDGTSAGAVVQPAAKTDASARK